MLILKTHVRVWVAMALIVTFFWDVTPCSLETGANIANKTDTYLFDLNRQVAGSIPDGVIGIFQ